SDFLLKPLSDHQVIESVTVAIAKDGVRLSAERLRTELLVAYQSLTTREREVLVHVVRGAMNKQIAAELGISDITVKVHRAAAMRKMRATSLADIVRKADLIGLTPDSDDRLPNHFVPNRRINDM
ncbi:response regulator transcription factor, partial [Cupriavidus sp. 8B]